MTDVPATHDVDLVGLAVTGGFAHFPGFAAERTVALGALDLERVITLLEAAEAAAIFTRVEPDKERVRPDERIWLLRIGYAGRSRLLAVPEQFQDLCLATLVSLARNCLSATQMVGNETPQIWASDEIVGRKPAAGSASILDALDTHCAGGIEVSFDRPVSSPRPAIFDWVSGAIRKQETITMTDGTIFGISGWFTPHGVRYHEDIRAVSEIAPADCSALLEHAEAIDFFVRPELGPADPLIASFTSRSRRVSDFAKLVINGPFEASELAYLIRLTKRVLNDRRVLMPETLGDEAFAALLTAQAAGPGVMNGASDASVICWPALTPAAGPTEDPKRD